MSNGNQETVAGIVAEMRKRAEEVYAGQAGYPESWKDQMNDDEIREIADRIEAAAKHHFREATKMILDDKNLLHLCNAEKMREALSMIVDACVSFHQFVENGLDGHYEAIPNYDGGVDDFLKCVDDAKAALSAPPRNCDVLSKDEVLEMLKDRSFSKEDTIEWLYAEAKGGAK